MGLLAAGPVYSMYQVRGFIHIVHFLYNETNESWCNILIAWQTDRSDRGPRKEAINIARTVDLKPSIMTTVAKVITLYREFVVPAITPRRVNYLRVSCQVHKIAGCACTRNAGNVFPATPRVSGSNVHHGTCVTHVP